MKIKDSQMDMFTEQTFDLQKGVKEL